MKLLGSTCCGTVYKAVHRGSLTFEAVDEVLKYDWYFPVVLIFTVYNLDLT